MSKESTRKRLRCWRSTRYVPLSSFALGSHSHLTRYSLFAHVGTGLGSQSQHLLIPYLTPHLANLTSSIRRLALIQYFKPFHAVRLGRMAEAFGLDEEVLLADVVDLVRSGEIEGRLDLHDRVRFLLPLPPGKTRSVCALFAHIFFAFALVSLGSASPYGCSSREALPRSPRCGRAGRGVHEEGHAEDEAVRPHPPSCSSALFRDLSTGRTRLTRMFAFRG